MGKSIEIEDLEIIQAFQGIEEDSWHKIVTISKKRHLKKGEILFLEKDKIDHLLGPGSLLNEVVFDDWPYL